MHTGARFARILDEKVGRVGAVRPAAGHAAYGRPHHPVVLLFHTGVHGVHRPAAHATRVASAYGIGHRARAAAAEPVAPPPSRPSRVLTDRQQQALAHMIGLGATLDADFTVRDLKGAFRTLARLYHPDRHPGSSEFEQARLGRQFAMLHDAYRQLLKVVSLPPAA
jgi:hypothetical protein